MSPSIFAARSIYKYVNYKQRHLIHQTIRSSSLSCPQKKDVAGTFPPRPDVQIVESEWYEWWKANNFFKRPAECPKFVMLLPPPNVTGKLHMGHAITIAIQDAIARWNQMCGKHVVWVPGCDHAGIATQAVVERHLLKTKNVTRHMLGKEEFQREASEWKEVKQKNIFEQIEKMGAILDWDRQYYTLDKDRSEAVNHAFIQLFEKGLIYRGNYIINWCPHLRSVISDSEVNHKNINGRTEISVPGYESPVTFGIIYDIAFKVDGSDEEIVVSTTRPETLPGDAAIMVHPEDSRYSHLEGKMAVHPLTGSLIPILLSNTVKKDMRTGAVKVTPAHSADDFDVGKQHNLPMPVVINDQGMMDTPDIPQIHGKPCYEARDVILSMLKESNHFRKEENHAMSIPICDRSGDIVQPHIKTQWFLKTEPMAAKLDKIIQSKDLRLHPASKYNVLKDFMDRRQDWCISRQLWWGHSIPVYWVSCQENTNYGDQTEIENQTGAFVAAHTEEEARQKGASVLGVEGSVLTIEKESDILDTWFSSSILPLSVFGWPHDLKNFKEHYPSSLLETGEDILFFWVTKMAMMGLELTGELPFKDVMFHGLFTDANKRKMSKSVGNVVDPIDVINHKSDDKTPNGLGVDALRFSLCSFKLNREYLHWDMRLAQKHYSFRNKLWQSVNFFLKYSEGIPGVSRSFKEDEGFHVLDRWVLSRMAKLVEDSNNSFEKLDDGLPTSQFNHFWINEFCSSYLNLCKLRVQRMEANPKAAETALRCYWTCIDTGIKLLHPFMPFLTEEIYQRLPSDLPKKESILLCDFPRTQDWQPYRDVQIEDTMKTFFHIIHYARSFRIAHKSKIAESECHVYCDDPSAVENLTPLEEELASLSGFNCIKIKQLESSKNIPGIGKTLDSGIKLIIPTEALVKS